LIIFLSVHLYYIHYIQSSTRSVLAAVALTGALALSSRLLLLPCSSCRFCKDMCPFCSWCNSSCTSAATWSPGGMGCFVVCYCSYCFNCSDSCGGHGCVGSQMAVRTVRLAGSEVYSCLAYPFPILGFGQVRITTRLQNR
jgi:hypothetical protein